MASRSGRLFKRGHLVQNWKERWFVAAGGMLTYYTDEGGEKKGEIALSGATVRQEGGDDLTFEIDNNGYRLALRANTKAEYDDWFRYLRQCALSVLKQGSLFKLGRKKVKNWKQRNFVLSRTSLAYFAEQGAAKGTILLADVRAAEPAPDAERELCFQLVGTGGDTLLVMQASSERVRREWLAAINEAIGAAAGGGGRPAAARASAAAAPAPAAAAAGAGAGAGAGAARRGGPAPAQEAATTQHVVSASVPGQPLELLCEGPVQDGTLLSAMANHAPVLSHGGTVQWVRSRALFGADEEPIAGAVFDAYTCTPRDVGYHIICKYAPPSSDAGAEEPEESKGPSRRRSSIRRTTTTLSSAMNAGTEAAVSASGRTDSQVRAALRPHVHDLRFCDRKTMVCTAMGKYREREILHASVCLRGPHSGVLGVQWLRSAPGAGADGAFVPVDEQPEPCEQYVLGPDDAECLVKCAVTVAVDGADQPTTVIESPPVGPGEVGPPRAQELTIVGDVVVGSTLTAQYEYWGGREGRSEIWWLRIAAGGGRANLTEPTEYDPAVPAGLAPDDPRCYVVKEEDVGAKFKCKVKPRRSDGVQGEVGTSKPTAAAALVSE